MYGDLINREEALKAIDKLYLDGEFRIYNDGSEIFAKCHNAISNVPAVDAEHVRHGQWEHGLQCPFCNQIDITKPNYCPNCGAKMDGEMKDDG